MKGITYGTRQMNKLLDDTLMQKYTFLSQTLMQLAGLAIAQISSNVLTRQNKNKVCVLVGPGNNGGDGLVAARHLKMMNYNVSLVLFKKLQGKNENFLKLCELNQIPYKSADTDFGADLNSQQTHNNFTQLLKSNDLIIDAIFGFPFTGQLRAPAKHFIPLLTPFQNNILSVDIPSGWDANFGNVNNLFTPKYLVELGMPKKCNQNFKGEHYLGGRFVPEKVAKQLGIVLPKYEGTELYVRL